MKTKGILKVTAGLAGAGSGPHRPQCSEAQPRHPKDTQNLTQNSSREATGFSTETQVTLRPRQPLKIHLGTIQFQEPSVGKGTRGWTGVPGTWVFLACVSDTERLPAIPCARSQGPLRPLKHVPRLAPGPAEGDWQEGCVHPLCLLAGHP